MILQMIGSNSFIHFLSNHVGMGSRLQVEEGDFIMISLTASLDIVANSENDELQIEESVKSTALELV